MKFIYLSLFHVFIFFLAYPEQSMTSLEGQFKNIKKNNRENKESFFLPEEREQILLFLKDLSFLKKKIPLSYIRVIDHAIELCQYIITLTSISPKEIRTLEKKCLELSKKLNNLSQQDKNIKILVDYLVFIETELMPQLKNKINLYAKIKDTCITQPQEFIIKHRLFFTALALCSIGYLAYKAYENYYYNLYIKQNHVLHQEVVFRNEQREQAYSLDQYYSYQQGSLRADCAYWALFNAFIATQENYEQLFANVHRNPEAAQAIVQSWGNEIAEQRQTCNHEWVDAYELVTLLRPERFISQEEHFRAIGFSQEELQPERVRQSLEQIAILGRDDSAAQLLANPGLSDQQLAAGEGRESFDPVYLRESIRGSFNSAINRANHDALLAFQSGAQPHLATVIRIGRHWITIGARAEGERTQILLTDSLNNLYTNERNGYNLLLQAFASLIFGH